MQTLCGSLSVALIAGATAVTSSGGSDSTSGEAAKRPILGEFEHQVMRAVSQLGEDAYGLNIARQLIERYGGNLAIAQVYVTLSRLEKKAFLSSTTTEPKPVKGGRARRVFILEGKGIQALEQSTTFRNALAASNFRGALHAPQKKGSLITAS
jgi:PadR family transcriptional regulator PadR